MNTNNNLPADKTAVVSKRKSNASEKVKEQKASAEADSNLSRIQLEKCPNSYPSNSHYFVLPAGGMHVAVPDLNFDANYFECESVNSNTMDKRVNNESKTSMDEDINSKTAEEALSKKASRRSPRLPLAVELTAGPGQTTSRKYTVRKAPPPSQTLLDSAALLKSYFSFSQNKDDKSDTSSENEETVKNKMMSLWHNMKYGWSTNLKTNFSREATIYLLGKVYHKTFKEEQKPNGSGGFVCSNIEGFKMDFNTLSWFTYRRKFPPLPQSTLTSDCGWGCMIRSGQMMMATALTRNLLPRGWRFSNSRNETPDSQYKQIIKWFCDSPSQSCPFSLHNLVMFGHKMNKKAGDWYGPSCVAHMLKEAVSEGSKIIPELGNLSIYIAQDGAVYIQDVLDMCVSEKCVCADKLDAELTLKTTNEVSFGSEAKPCATHFKYSFPYSEHCNSTGKLKNSNNVPLNCDTEPGSSNISPFMPAYVHLEEEISDKEKEQSISDNKSKLPNLRLSPCNKEKNSLRPICERCHGWKSCLILIPVRLGGASLNPIYKNCIYSLFLHDLCVGIIGGRPKHSLYFVGFQEDSLIHLDPHFSQDAIPLESEDFLLSSYHCSSPRKIPISKMDPSATIGFYCHTRKQFLRFLQDTPMMARAKDGNLVSPIFELIDGRCEDVNGWHDETLNEDTTRMSFSSTPPLHSPDNEESEELVFE